VLQDERRRISRPISRRAALQLGVGAGAAAVAAPYLGNLTGERAAFGAKAALVPNPNWPVPPIITRAQWGANEALRQPGQIYNSQVLKIVVHHTGSPNDITDIPALLRNVLSYETSNGYIDIAYNWLIDQNGNIYEGRWAQNYPGGAAHNGELNGKNVQGAHAIYHNVDTIGIAMIGTYDVVTPPPVMVNTLLTMLTWKCARWAIDPNGMVPYNASNGVYETNLANICGHRDTEGSSTDCPGQLLEPMLPSLRNQVAARLTGGGYWIASGDGQVIPFGGVPSFGGYPRIMSAFAGHPSGQGYWLCTPDGAVYSSGVARYHGGMSGTRLAAPIIGMTSTASGNGYWLVARDGGIFTFGDAKFHGSMGGIRLNAPVLGMVATKTGNGYWLYARDGGVFTFGDAKFMGSTGGMRLNRPVVGMAARPQGDGYWLVGGDGGIFTFGNARYRGSGANLAAAQTVAMLPTTTGNGYVILRNDGRVDAYGDAVNMGGGQGLIAGGAIGIAGKLKPL
jgi:hypothetical protein